MTEDIRGKVVIVSPTESSITMRGDRHPALARYLHGRGCQVLYVTSDFSHWNKHRFSTSELAKLADAPYEVEAIRTPGYRKNIGVGRLGWNVYFANMVALRLLRRVQESDVLLVPSRPPEVMLSAAIVKQWTGCRAVLDVRDVWPDGLPLDSSLSSRGFARYCDAINRNVVARFDDVVYTCPSFVDWIERHRPGLPSTFVPLGFDPLRWGDSKPIDSGSFERPLRFIWVGDITANMDIMPLIRALAARNDTTLTMIGGGAGLKEVRRHCSSAGMTNVVFEGYVPRGRVPELVASSHVAVIPMLAKHAMPNKLFDFIGAQRPILSFGTNDTSRLVVDAGIGWRLPFEEEAVRRFLDRLDFDEVVSRSETIGAIRERFSREQTHHAFATVLLGDS